MLLAIAQVGASALVVPPVGARSLGTLEISEAGLGTLNLALDKTEDPAAADALRSAVASGCNFLDVRSRFELASPHSPTTTTHVPTSISGLSRLQKLTALGPAND